MPETSSTKPSQQPQDVVIAIGLLCGSLLIGALNLIISPNPIPAQNPFCYLACVATFTAASLLFLISKIAAGKNWARFIITGLFVLGLFPTAAALILEFNQNLFLTLLRAIQIVMQSVALILLFTPDAETWFQNKNPLSQQ